MADKAAEVAATGGSRPAATGPGAAGGGPTGGGAVPSAEVLMGGSGSLGDTGSMDDAGLNSGDSLEESAGAAGGPQSAMPNTENATGTADTTVSGDAPVGEPPTGGLSGTPVPSSGTVGGSPTGASSSGMGS